MKIDRRSFVKTAAVAAGALATPTFFTRQSWANNFTNDPGDNKSVVFGFPIPQTGPYADEGADELRGFKLAVKHLNGEGDGGLLNTLKPLSLKGNGILGKKVEYLVGDTQTDTATATRVAKDMIESANATMVCGGSSSDAVIAMQSVCHDAGVIFMAGLSHSNDTTGKFKRRYGFKHFFNAYMSAAALGPVLLESMGRERRAYHLSSDYSWGLSQEEAMRDTTKALGWETVDAVRTPLGCEDYTPYLEPIINSGADVLILNNYGSDVVKSLTQAVEAGLRDRQVNGRPFEIVVPLLSRLVAKGAGDNIKGILGTTNWNWALQDRGSQTFVRSFGQEYGFPPSQAAHTCYVQTLLYANACEMAGTFHPQQVIPALEGFAFDGAGNGPTLYRAADHQCFKDVLVVRGNKSPSSPFDLLEVIRQVYAEQVSYDPSIFGGELGPYKT